MEHAARLARDGAGCSPPSRPHVAPTSERRPLLAYRVEELAEMSRDIFDDRNGFTAARRAFVHHQPAPLRLPPLETSSYSLASEIREDQRPNEVTGPHRARAARPPRKKSGGGLGGHWVTATARPLGSAGASRHGQRASGARIAGAVQPGHPRCGRRRGDHRLLPPLVEAEGQGRRHLSQRFRLDRDRRDRPRYRSLRSLPRISRSQESPTWRASAGAPRTRAPSTTTPSSTAWSSTLPADRTTQASDLVSSNGRRHRCPSADEPD